ncbi:MAG: hypothetical protein WBF77_09800 [Sulfurimonadaceae bacterium]
MIDEKMLNTILLGGGKEAVYVAIRKLFYFCDYDGLGFTFKLNNENFYNTVETFLDPIFVKLEQKDFKEYTKQKELFLEYLEYRVTNLEYQKYSEQDFKDAVFYFKNIYFQKIENSI